MGQGDFIPIGGHRRTIDPKRIKELQEGGKKADKIHKEAEAHHKEHDVPKAEEELLKDLGNISKEETFTPPNN